MNPKVSFLITYYNQAQYVKQSLESCLNQKYDGSIEILIADDGSSDGTVEIVNKYIEKYPNVIKLYRMPRTSGVVYNSIERVSAARIFLLDKATGEYFCTLDGDDWYCNNSFVQKGINILTKDKTISVCAFLYKMWYDENHIDNTFWYKSSKRVPAKKYIKSHYIHAGACIHRKNWNNCKDFDYIKSTGYFDDNDILIYTLNKGDMYFIPDIVYSYRQTVDSSWNSSTKLLKDLINVWTFELETKYSKYPKEILFRYYKNIYSLYKNKCNINKLYSEKNKIYFDYARNVDTIFLKDILFYNELSKREIKLFKNKFRKINYFNLLDNIIFIKIARHIFFKIQKIIGDNK